MHLNSLSYKTKVETWKLCFCSKFPDKNKQRKIKIKNDRKQNQIIEHAHEITHIPGIK